MLINTTLGKPTIDKIHLKTYDYRLSICNKFRMRTETSELGIIDFEKYYYNSQICNINIESDKQGKDVAKIYFNPNKSDIEQVYQECRNVGLDFSILDSQVIRADIERHQQLSQNLKTYHSILFQSASGKNLLTTNNQSFRIGTKSLQIELYDKSVQAKLDEPNIIRVESRYMKSQYLIRENIFTLESLLNADTSKLMQLYDKPRKMYLNNLEKLKGNTLSNQVGNYVALLEMLHQTSNRPVTSFFEQVGIEKIGLENSLIIINSADIGKQKRYNARKHALKLASEICVPNQSEKVDEILSYFNLAS